MPNSDRPETFIINGLEVTARQLAEARQELARRSPFNVDFIPRFEELTQHEQDMSVIDAQNYLIALVSLAITDARPDIPEGES